jgi:hypothetical protein
MALTGGETGAAAGTALQRDGSELAPHAVVDGAAQGQRVLAAGGDTATTAGAVCGDLETQNFNWLSTNFSITLSSLCSS